MWWALIEEIAPRAEEMACEKQMACCVRDVYQVYKDIWAAAIGEVLVCSREPTNIGKFLLQNYIHVKTFRTFSVYKIIFTTKKKRITVIRDKCNVTIYCELVSLQVCQCRTARNVKLEHCP